MNRVQFYPTDNLYRLLKEEAESNYVSISTKVEEILNGYFCLEPDAPSITQLTKDSLDEVSKFIADPGNKGKQFDLKEASPAFRNIPMTLGKKPSAIRANIGKIFKTKVQNGDYPTIEIVEEKLSPNNAMLYRVK